MHIDDSLAGLDARRRRRRRSPTSARAPGSRGSCWPTRCPDARVICVEAARSKADWIAATAARCGLDERRGRAGRARRSGTGTAERRRRPARWRRCRCCASTPRRCCATGGRAVFWKGAVDAGEEADGRARGGGPRAVGARGRARHAVPGHRAADAVGVRRASGRCPTGSRAVREWRVKRPLRADGSGPNPPPRSTVGPDEPSTRSPTRRAGWARPPPPSTSPPASPRRATARCSWTSTRRATRPPASALERVAPGLYDVLGGEVEAARGGAPVRRSSDLDLLVSTPDLAGATMELPRLPGSENRLREALAPACATPTPT